MGRFAIDNVWHLSNFIDVPNPANNHSVILSLDAEKAFDCVEWWYLWWVLTRFGFGSHFIHMVQTLYKNSLAGVWTGLSCSSTFQLSRGTRQACPLLPLLFVISLETLAQAICQNHTISPITIHSCKHYISLFADDILLYLSNVPTSISQCLKIFKDFRNVCGCKINLF